MQSEQRIHLNTFFVGFKLITNGENNEFKSSSDIVSGKLF